MQDIKSKIQADLKSAMLVKDQRRVNAIRMLMSAIKQKEVDERLTATDEDIIFLTGKLIKQRRESIQQFSAGGRQDLVDQEQAEIEILQAYLPAQLDPTELQTLIKEAITAANAVSVKDLGKIIKLLEPKIKGRADMTAVVAKIKEQLT